MSPPKRPLFRIVLGAVLLFGGNALVDRDEESVPAGHLVIGVFQTDAERRGDQRELFCGPLGASGGARAERSFRVLAETCLTSL